MAVASEVQPAAGRDAGSQPDLTPRRPTSVWIPIDKLLPHPANPNRMSEETLRKLEANIESGGGIYPPIIARSLELSQAFKTEFEAGLVQIIDGEHRWSIARRRGDREAEVRIWPAITDARAWQFLLTLNRLQGRDDAKRRNALIRGLAEIEDPSLLAQILPEDLETITRTVAEAAKDAVSGAAKRAAEVSMIEPLTIFARPDQVEVIRRGMKRWLDRHDPQNQIQECREGEALGAIAEIYLGSDG